MQTILPDKNASGPSTPYLPPLAEMWQCQTTRLVYLLAYITGGG